MKTRIKKTYTFTVDDIVAAMKMYLAQTYDENPESATVKFEYKTLPGSDFRDPPTVQLAGAEVHF